MLRAWRGCCSPELCPDHPKQGRVAVAGTPQNSQGWGRGRHCSRPAAAQGHAVWGSRRPEECRPGTPRSRVDTRWGQGASGGSD